MGGSQWNPPQCRGRVWVSVPHVFRADCPRHIDNPCAFPRRVAPSPVRGTVPQPPSIARDNIGLSQCRLACAEQPAPMIRTDSNCKNIHRIDSQTEPRPSRLGNGVRGDCSPRSVRVRCRPQVPFLPPLSRGWSRDGLPWHRAKCQSPRAVQGLSCRPVP